MLLWSELRLLDINLTLEDYALRLPAWLIDDLLVIKAVESEYIQEMQKEQ